MGGTLTDADVGAPGTPEGGTWIDPSVVPAPVALSDADIGAPALLAPPAPPGVLRTLGQHLLSAAAGQGRDAALALTLNPDYSLSDVGNPQQAANTYGVTPGETFLGGGYKDAHYLAARAGDIAGGSFPTIALGAVGAATGGVLTPESGGLGAIPGAAIGAGLGSGVPAIAGAYRNARAGGLDQDAAATQALKSAGVAGLTAAAMGAAGGLGKLFEASFLKEGEQIVVKAPLVRGDKATDFLTSPTGQALVTQPAIGQVGLQGQDAVTGHQSTLAEKAADYVQTAVPGYGLTAIHGLAGRDAAGAPVFPDAEPTPAPAPEQPLITGAQAPEPAPAVLAAPEPAAPTLEPAQTQQVVAPPPASVDTSVAPVPAPEPPPDVASPAPVAPQPAIPAGPALTDADIGAPAPALPVAENGPGATPGIPSPAGEPAAEPGAPESPVARADGAAGPGASNEPGRAGVAEPEPGGNVVPGGVTAPGNAEAAPGSDSAASSPVAADVAPIGESVNERAADAQLPADVPGGSGPGAGDGAEDAPVVRGVVGGNDGGDGPPLAAEGQRGADRAGLVPETRAETVTTAAGRKVATRFEVVPGASLKAAAGDLQPRDRAGRAASDAQITAMSASLDPARLHSSPEADRGAPIVGPDDTVESGNGRVAAIMQAHDAGRSGPYLDMMRARGFDTAGVDRPVLVRRRTTFMDDATRRAFVGEANQSATQEMSAPERARADARNLTPALLDMYDAGTGGGPGTAANRDFTRAWVATLPEAERNNVMDADGVLSSTGSRRIEGAMLAKAYGDSGTLSRALESTDDNARAITGAMVDAAPQWARLRSGIEAGAVPGAMDLAPALTRAADLVSQARARGQSPADIVNQQDVFNPLGQDVEQFVRAMLNPALTRGAARPMIGTILRRYADEAAKQTTGLSLFGDGDRLDPVDILRTVRASVARELEPAAPAPVTTDMFRGAPSRGEAGPGAEPALPATRPVAAKSEEAQAGLKRLRAKAEAVKTPKLSKAGAAQAMVQAQTLARWEAEGRTDSDAYRTLKAQHDRLVAGDKAPDGETLAMRAPASYDPAVRGNLPRGHENLKPSHYARQTYDELGFKDPDAAVSLPAAIQMHQLKAAVQSRFGLKGVDIHPGSAPRQIIDQLVDAHRGMQVMAAGMGVPPAAIGLDGTLRLWLGPMGEARMQTAGGQALGMFQPSTNTIFVPGRASSFAHEWTHALDARLARSLGTGTGASTLLSRTPAEWADAPTGTPQAAMGRLMGAIYGRDAQQAADLFKARVVDAGSSTPATQAALARAQSAMQETDFLRNAKALGTPYHSDPSELLARSHEAYLSGRMGLIDPAGSNAFVSREEVEYLNAADHALNALYPKADDRAAIDAAWENMHDTLRQHALWPAGPDATVPRNDTLGIGPDHYGQWSGGQATPAALAQQTAASARQVGTLGLIMEALRNGGLDTDHGTDPGILTRKVRAVDALVLATHSPRGVAQHVIARQPVAARSHLQGLLDQLTTDPGSGRRIGQTYEEEVHTHTRRDHNAYAAAAQSNGLAAAASWKQAARLTDQEAVQVHQMLTHRGALEGLPEHIQKAARDSTLHRLSQADKDVLTDRLEMSGPRGIPIHVKRFASDLRFQLDQKHYEANAVGLPVAYADGYFPRKFNDTLIQSQPAEFEKDITPVFALKAKYATEDDGQALADLFHRVQGTMLPATAEGIAKRLRAARQAHAQVNAAIVRGDPGADLDEPTAADLFPVQADRDMIQQAYGAAAAKAMREQIELGSPTDFGTKGPSNDHLAARSLPPEADDMLRRWYHIDPHAIIPDYLQSMNRKIAYTRRFGADGAGIETALRAARDAGSPTPDVKQMRYLAEVITGRSARNTYPGALMGGLDFVHGLGTMALLPRSVFSGIFEPLAVLARTGNARATFENFAHIVREGRRTGEAQRVNEIASFIGLVSHAAYETTQLDRTGATYSDSFNMGPLMLRYFRQIGITQMTNAQRRGGLVAGTYWMQDLARTMLGQGRPGTFAHGRKVEDARNEFRNFGIPDSDHLDFARWISNFTRVPDISDMNGNQNGEHFKTFINRFVDTVNQAPKASEVPLLSADPLGKHIFGLMSFNFSWFNNIVNSYIESTKHKLHNTTSRGGKAGVIAAAGLRAVPGVAALWFGSYLSTVLREAVFNGTTFDEHRKAGDLQSWLAELSYNRIGLNGPVDPIIQAISGLKYKKSLSSLAVGAQVGNFLANGEKMANGLTALFGGGQAAPHSNIAYYNGVVGAYNMLAAPAEAAGLSMIGNTPFTRGAAGGAMMSLTSPEAADWVAKHLVGPKGSTDEESAPVNPEEPADPADMAPDQEPSGVSKAVGLVDDVLPYVAGAARALPAPARVAAGALGGAYLFKKMHDAVAPFTVPPASRP